MAETTMRRVINNNVAAGETSARAERDSQRRINEWHVAQRAAILRELEERNANRTARARGERA